MTTHTLMITPNRYFKSDISLNEENIKTFRDLYRKLSQTVQFDGHEIDVKALLSAAQQLSVQADSNDYQELLQECVRYDDEQDTFLCVSIFIEGSVQPLSLSLHANSVPQPSPIDSEPALERSKEDKIPTILKEVECVLIIKHRGKDVTDFLQTFLLQIAKQDSAQKSACDNTSLQYNQKFILNPRSLLALFIHEQLQSLGTIRQRPTAHLRLVEPFTTTDEFGTWSYDHFQGLFEIELHPHREKFFPTWWDLANDASIHCQIVISGTHQASETTMSQIPERPGTGSLEQFVRDVCAKEDNSQGETWLNALYKEDVLSFVHLSNLKQIEWDKISKLTMNAKKILKSAVDRERESAADDQRRLFEESSPNEELPKSSENQQKESRSELLANLHLIKLFIYYTLRFERALQYCNTLSKLEPTCIDISFDEMRDEGYADDGLFSAMGEFFLPLTISEQELRKARLNVSRQERQKQLVVLTKEVHDLENFIKEATENRWDVDEKITDLKKSFNAAYIAINDHSQVDTTKTSREQAEEMQQLDREWKYNRTQFEEQLLQYENKLDQWKNCITDYDKQIDEKNNRINNIQIELSQPERPVDKGLIKPSRGFIMYGPPGTGKSEIMSKLSTKLGIAMVGPPLAAGELNRPLVGESERVIIALASRCHRVPYAMCCLAIDEIDSLAPKRDEDSSEGKVDKISVLLSLIDGIKDVPNLMIFCATNRLHMMDEAFLRRMSGKFFVGRPSSLSRTKILAQIPEWALESNLIDLLAIASTNFSGAACKAFTRAITVHCITVQRKEPNYHINYKEALEIADRTAQQYQIFIGSETLPCLLLRNLNSGKNIRNHLSRRRYAGRIIIDLHGGSARIEIIETENHIDHIAVIEHKLNSNETTVQNLLERLTTYGKDRNVQLIQLVDLNLLASQGAYDDKKVFETLKERYDECIAYNRSMIIYDLDALVGVNKSESDSSMGRSNSSSVVNQSVYTYVRARFRETVVEPQQQANVEQQTKERWAVAVIREPFLLRQFSSDVQFARTKHEEEELELERRKAEDLLKCVKCKDLYIENENKMGNCVHHDGFIYDNSAPDLSKYTQSQVAYILNKLECDIINDSESREKLEREKNKFKWICCDMTVTTSTGSGGCKKGKHGFDQQAVGGQWRNGRRLDQKTIKQWEDECHRNQEYNEKWLLLLEDRS